MEDAACHLYTVEAVHLSEKCSLPSAIKFLSLQKKNNNTTVNMPLPMNDDFPFWAKQ